MTCVICKQTNVQPGTATVTLERDGMTLVVKHVAALVYQNCGEEFVNEEAAAHLLATAEHAVNSGVQVDIREYAAV